MSKDTSIRTRQDQVLPQRELVEIRQVGDVTTYSYRVIDHRGFWDRLRHKDGPAATMPKRKE